MPDRLPSLIVLVAFWIPPALAGWTAGARRGRATLTHAGLGLFVAAYALAWFYFNLGRMPPYMPGATMDSTVAAPEATRWLAVVTAALVLPGSALACFVAFGRRRRMVARA